MRRPLTPLAAAMGVALTLALHANPQQTTTKVRSNVRVTFELADGSRLKGEPLPEYEQLPLRCDLGDVSIPLSLLTQVEMQPDTETIVASFRNGDRLTGFPRTSGMTLSTVLGELTVPWSAVKSCEVSSVAPPPMEAGRIKPVSVRVSGHYGSETALMAVDGNVETRWSSGDWKGWIELDLGAVYELDRIAVTLQFSPTGNATHAIYVSDVSFTGNLQELTLLKRFSGTRRTGDVLAAECPAGTKGRYVLIHCPGSRAWFNVSEVKVLPHVHQAVDRR